MGKNQWKNIDEKWIEKVVEKDGRKSDPKNGMKKVVKNCE